MAILPISCVSSDSILVVAPHPDDECIGAGGVLSLYPELCDIIVLSDGCHGAQGVSQTEERKIRRQQFEDEMQHLKPRSYQWMGYEDGTLMEHPEILNAFDFSSYTKIFLPWYDDNHLDHTATYMYAIQRVIQQRHIQTEIYQYEVHVPFHDVTHFLDITDVIDTKRRLIQFHRDQIKLLPYDMMSMALGKYRACQAGFTEGYIEAYLAVDISADIPSDALLEREKELHKFRLFYHFLISWLYTRQDGKSIAQYLLKHGFSSVSIYGYAEIGQLLYRELSDSDVKVIEILDRRSLNVSSEVSVVKPEEGDISIDAVIVTAISSFDEIKNNLLRMKYRNIISLSDIVRDM